ncbi:hypothetical protein [Brevifollis gellanilyticus]|uniref:Uncharacterized protein n=1 Tax=Brevifollis gellanilyticus TaxID=748831 RepID=A0A512M7T7_9BACT|nr:hypothetical protein [Brevifollis gellanilyticus]GEP42800.1 hypothetical protein BGE01nite_20910 [Brevifollis gellanilyticus]
MPASALQIMLALLMAVPLHFCCWMGLMKPAGGEEACMSCHQFLTPEERSELPAVPPAKDRHCECCDGTLQRDQTPVALSAPKALLHVLPMIPWAEVSYVLLPVLAPVSQRHILADERPPPDPKVPLYQRHCALLI